ncbi:MAG TPA: MBL fold metallo-hydrolase [Thermomicrobiales bacterium]|nr:MBL fold metallo-hydrolase [Thermomicrobiales bacterium]
MRVSSLASGSSGNALAIEHEGQTLLVDCGCQPRRLAQLLGDAGVDLTTLAAVLLTHEHSDHVAGLAAIPPALGAPLVMTPGTRLAEPLVGGLPAFAGRPVVEQPTGSTRTVGRFEVTSFPVSHDGAEVCGYLVAAGGHRVAIFTDLGVAEPHLREPLAAADLVVLEANHDEQLLWRGPYPWPLKKRVAGDRGHLSNDACAALLCDVLPATGREVWLAHLSRTNNRHQLARAAVQNALDARGLYVHAVRVLPQYGATLRWEPQTVQLALNFAASQ